MYFRSWFFSCSFLVHMKGEKRLGILADSDVSAKRSCARGDAAFPLTQSTDFDSGSEGEDFTPSPPPRYSHNHIPKMAEFMTTFITRPIRAISFDFEQLVRDAAGLLNKPQVKSKLTCVSSQSFWIDSSQLERVIEHFGASGLGIRD